MPVTLNSTGGGSVTLTAANTGSAFTLTAPANTGTLLTTGATVTVAQGGTGLTSLGTGVTTALGNAVNGASGLCVQDASGNLGVGVSPTYRLDASTSSSRIANFNTTNANGGGFAIQTSGTDRIFIGSAKWLVTGGNLADCGIDVSGANNLILATNDVERARIDSSGNLLVGTTNSAVGSYTGMRVISSGARLEVGSSASTNSDIGFDMYSTGASAYRFYVGYGGTIYATSTTISSISDRRFKENIIDLDVGLAALLSLKPRKFDWKTGKGKDIRGDRGWIADEFQQVFPDLIDTWKDAPPEGEEPYKAVRPDLMPVVVKAIQELSAKLEAAEARIASLEGSN